MSKLSKKVLKWFITIAIVVVSVYLSLLNIDLEKLLAEFTNINIIWAIIPIPIMIFSHYLRAIRWRTILKPIMKADSTLNLFSAVMVGYFFNNILPRGGEIIRPYVYSKREKKSFSTIFATIVLERFLDVFTLLFLFLIALIFTYDKIMSAFPEGSDFSKLLYLVAIGILVFFVALYPPVMEKILKYTLKPINQKFYEKILVLFNKFKHGFEILKTPSQYIRIIIESLAIWACYALPMYIMFYCFDFSANMSLGITDAVLLIVISGIGVSIAPSPGGIGVFHMVVTVAVVQLYGVTKEQALAFATLNHIVNFAVQVIIGFGFFLRERITHIPSDDEIGAISTSTNSTNTISTDEV